MDAAYWEEPGGRTAVRPADHAEHQLGGEQAELFHEFIRKPAGLTRINPGG
jgi:hypothetical protein